MSMQQALGVEGGTQTIVLGRKSYSTRVWQLRDYAEIEARIVADRGSPRAIVEAVKQQFSGDPKMLAAVMRGVVEGLREWAVVDAADLAEYLRSFDGLLFSTWLAIRHNDQSLTLEKVTDLVCNELDELLRDKGLAAMEARQREIERVISFQNGASFLGNSSAPSAPLGSGETATAATSTGESSSDTSESSTASPPPTLAV